MVDGIVGALLFSPRTQPIRVTALPRAIHWLNVMQLALASSTKWHTTITHKIALHAREI
jgi:hypothetical protein